jgi:THO complex subunit 4
LLTLTPRLTSLIASGIQFSLRYRNQPHLNIFPRAPNKVNPPKAQKPKAVAKPAAKPAAARGRAGTRGGKRGGRAGSGSGSGSGRGKPKTAEELDQEMADYFGGDVNPSGNAVPVATSTAATNGGDVGMEDTVLVGTP